MREIVPFNERARRAPEAGRIRLGVKTAKAMKAIDTFRFTSQHHDLIRALADAYGGTPGPWNEPKARIANQWEVVTTSNKIEVLLPPGGLSQWYELWSGGGCTRRCDGITAEVPVQGPDGSDMSNTPCICTVKQRQECQPYTRMNVILPGIDFAGTWRLETKGENAAVELPGMHDMISQFSEQGAMVKAFLHLEHRTSVRAGKTRKFVVATLSVGATPTELLAGGGTAHAQLTASGSSDVQDMAELTRGGPVFDETETPDVLDVEIVGDDDELRVEELVRNTAQAARVDPDWLVDAMWSETNGDLALIEKAIRRMADGKILATNVAGALKWEVVK